jgi:hypothetical protein
VSDHQNVVWFIMGGTSKMNSPLHVRERRPSLFDEDTSRVSELHNLFIVASEQVKSIVFFDLSDLFAERRLGNVQSVGGPSKAQLLGQNNDCVQVPEFNVGEHCSKPLSPNGRNR